MGTEEDLPIVWIDLEMTGLDLKKDMILEIAIIVTDKNLSPFDEGIDIIIHQTNEVLNNMNEWCIQHHGESGLTKSCRLSKVSLQEAERQALAYIQKYVPQPRTAVLGGNSVHVDRQFLGKDMPKLLEHLHYRIIDVSTVKELARRWSPNAFETAPQKKLSHRALDDIKESIQELQHYRQTFLGWNM